MTDEIEVRTQRPKDWFWINNELLKHWGEIIGPGAIAVYAALAMHADYTDQDCHPSYTTIATLTGMSRPTAIKWIAVLEAVGLVASEERTISTPDGNERNLTNVYTLLPVKSLTEEEREHYKQVVNEVVKNFNQGGSKDSLLGVVKKSNQGGKDSLPEQKSLNKSKKTSSGASAPPSTKKSSKPKVPRAGPDPGTQVILEAYKEVLGYNSINYGKEGKAAKKLAADGWAPEQVAACYEHMKADEFWADKHLSLQKVYEQIGAWSQSHARQSAPTGATVGGMRVLNPAKRGKAP